MCTHAFSYAGVYLHASFTMRGVSVWAETGNRFKFRSALRSKRLETQFDLHYGTA